MLHSVGYPLRDIINFTSFEGLKWTSQIPRNHHNILLRVVQKPRFCLVKNFEQHGLPNFAGGRMDGNKIIGMLSLGDVAKEMIVYQKNLIKELEAYVKQ